MKIHEYQAKELFRKYGVPVPKGKAVFSSSEAKAASEDMDMFPVVVKAQIHAGGRGKGGGVKLAKTHDEVKQIADDMLGMTLVTHQTGKEGRIVKKLLIEEGAQIEKELYLAIMVDRESASPVIIASEAGGMDIEEVSASSPEKIIKVAIDPSVGILPFHARKLAFSLRLPPELIKGAVSLITNLYKLFVAEDCSLVEINPLIITKDNQLKALDGKITFDDNALFRHKSTIELRDIAEEEPLEVEASKYNLNYIKIDGNIGCMVNGAGLAMATMDIIKISGGEPVNFLDVGGGANAEMVENAFRILLSDKNVRAVLINIFGGILRCDILAQGVVEAASKINIDLPIVIRLEGTNVEQGRQILESSNVEIIVANTMKEAAEKVVRTI